MSKGIVIEEDGWLDVTVPDAAGNAAPYRLDVLKAYNSYATITAERESETERAAAWIEFLTGEGLPALSTAAAFKIAAALIREVQGEAPAAESQATPEGE